MCSDLRVIFVFCQAVALFACGVRLEGGLIVLTFKLFVKEVLSV